MAGGSVKVMRGKSLIVQSNVPTNTTRVTEEGTGVQGREDLPRGGLKLLRALERVGLKPK